MTARELKDLLADVSDNTQVVFKPQNSDYVEGFTEVVKRKRITAFWGKDFEAYVINGEQTGRVQ